MSVSVRYVGPHSETKENVRNFLVVFLAKRQAEMTKDKTKTTSINGHFMETNTNTSALV